MVIINKDPWDKGEKEEEAPSSPQEANPELFGFQDLASDYFQVRSFAKLLLLGITVAGEL